MMNVGIIFYAARETNDKRLREIAVRHCLTTRRYLVRGDGSTAHEGIFDLETGEFLRQTTQQGFRGDSCWSRGLAWALYGFTTSYEYSRDPRFLQTAEACADYYITQHRPTVFRRGITMPRPRIARWWIPRRRRSRRPGLSALVPARRRSHEGPLLLVDRDSYPSHALRRIPGRNDPKWEGVLKGGVYHSTKAWASTNP